MCGAESLTWAITITVCGTRQCISQRCRYISTYKRNVYFGRYKQNFKRTFTT